MKERMTLRETHHTHTVTKSNGRWLLLIIFVKANLTWRCPAYLLRWGFRFLPARSWCCRAGWRLSVPLRPNCCWSPCPDHHTTHRSIVEHKAYLCNSKYVTSAYFFPFRTCEMGPWTSKVIFHRNFVWVKFGLPWSLKSWLIFQLLPKFCWPTSRWCHHLLSVHHPVPPVHSTYIWKRGAAEHLLYYEYELISSLIIFPLVPKDFGRNRHHWYDGEVTNYSLHRIIDSKYQSDSDDEVEMRHSQTERTICCFDAASFIWTSIQSHVHAPKHRLDELVSPQRSSAIPW